MAFSDKNTILNVIMMIGLFSSVFLIFSLFFVERFTGDLVLTGSINHGETLEGRPIFIKNNDVTFSFGTTVAGSGRSELLNIKIITPEGSEYSWVKKFRCNPDSACTDNTMIFKPISTGQYYIKISDADFHTNIKIISGMVNPLKKPLIFIGAIVFSIVGIIFTAKVFNHEVHNPSKKQTLIALIFSLITTYFVVLYASM